jgi:DNA replication protein DnaC
MRPLSELFTQLRLHGFGPALETLLSDPAMTKMSFDEKLRYLCEAEISLRETRKLERFVKRAKLPFLVQPHQVQCEDGRGLDRSYLYDLLNSDWVERNQKVLISGATGTGKSWLACALGLAAIKKGYPVRYFSASQLFHDLAMASASGNAGRFRMGLQKARLLIIDDFGTPDLPVAARSELYDLIYSREENCSTLFTTQRLFQGWHDYIGEPILADSIMDRVKSKCHFIDLLGDSWRKSL